MAASERNPYERGWHWRRVRGLSHRRLVFLDESAVNTAMTQTHGRAPRGERVHDSAPRNCGEQTSLVGVLSFGRGLLAVMTQTGAVNTLAFDAYLSRMPAPRLRKGDVVVLDNLNVHKASQVLEVAEARGARVLWLAPYSPDFSPIEQCWSRLSCGRRKRLQRRADACDLAAEAPSRGRRAPARHRLAQHAGPEPGAPGRVVACQ